MRCLTVVLMFLCSGCSALLVHQDDPAPVIVAKTLWRTMLGVSTLGFSEIRMSELREEANTEILAEQRLQDYESHLTYLVNNGALTQLEAEDLYQKYAALILQETLDVSGGMDPMETSANSVLWYGGTLYGSYLRYPSNSVRTNWRNDFAQISAMGRPRTYAARWSKLAAGSRGPYFRGVGTSKGSGRRGGRR